MEILKERKDVLKKILVFKKILVIHHSEYSMIISFPGLNSNLSKKNYDYILFHLIGETIFFYYLKNKSLLFQLLPTALEFSNSSNTAS